MAVSELMKELLEDATPLEIDMLTGYGRGFRSCYTGSTVFFPTTHTWENTDVDLVVSPDAERTIKTLVMDKKLVQNYDEDKERGYEFQSYYGKTENGAVINVILCLSNDDFDAWSIATGTMQELLRKDDNDPLTELLRNDKEARIRVFEAFFHLAH